MVQPWEKKMVPVIEKAIRDSDLGLNPATSSDVIRVPMQPLTACLFQSLRRFASFLLEDLQNQNCFVINAIDDTPLQMLVEVSDAQFVAVRTDPTKNRIHFSPRMSECIRFCQRFIFGSIEMIKASVATEAFISGADGDRTRNLSIANAALSQLSYGPGRYLSVREVARDSVAVLLSQTATEWRATSRSDSWSLPSLDAAGL